MSLYDQELVLDQERKSNLVNELSSWVWKVVSTSVASIVQYTVTNGSFSFILDVNLMLIFFLYAIHFSHHLADFEL